MDDTNVEPPDDGLFIQPEPGVMVCLAATEASEKETG